MEGATVMDYVEWVEQVMIATANAIKSSSASQQFIGVDLRNIAAQLDLGEEVLGRFQDSEYYMPMWNAIKDLGSIGLVEGDTRLDKLTNEENKFQKYESKLPGMTLWTFISMINNSGSFES